MGELASAFSYQVTQGKNISSIRIAFNPSQLPYIAVQKNGHIDGIQSIPYMVPIREKRCYLYQPAPHEASQAYIEIPEPYDDSWVLPLFYFADSFLGIPKTVVYSDKLINTERSVTLLSQNNILQKAKNLIAVFGAVQYLQAHTLTTSH